MSRMGNKGQQRILIACFLIVPLVLLATFTFYPIVKLFQLSFVEWDGIQAVKKVVFFDNYIKLFKDPNTYLTLANTSAYLVIAVIQAAVALALAILLDGGIRGAPFFKSLIFMPYILNGVAVAFMFNYMYDFVSGPINVVLRHIGLERYAIRWFTDSYGINYSLALIGLWRYTGLNMVIFLGALQSVPPTLYQAAELDGASFLQKVRYITLPSITRVIEILLFLNVAGGMQAFFEPFILTQGGPGMRSTTFVIYTLYTAFKFQNFGKASAMGVTVLLLIMSLGLVQRKIVTRAE